jgi:hypothetical protein
MAEKRWHVDRWPPLSKAETLIKLAAFGFAYAAFATSTGRATMPIVQNGATLAQIGILGVLSLGLTAAVWDRWRRREVVSMAFVLLNAPAHWLLFAALLRSAEVDFWLFWFAELMLLGDLIKVLSFYVRPFPVRDLSPAVGTALTGIYAVGYLAIILLPQLAMSVS